MLGLHRGEPGDLTTQENMRIVYVDRGPRTFRFKENMALWTFEKAGLHVRITIPWQMTDMQDRAGRWSGYRV